MNTMTYQGYTARIDFDERDNIFVGRVLGLRSILGFHGETVKQLRSEFKVAVEDYLADCKEQGISPEKAVSGKLLLRMPPEIHSKALVRAQASGKSLNQWATEALERAVAADGLIRAESPGFPENSFSHPAPSPCAFGA
jgi:predicted HicB family RNase H-like nuclease